MMICLPLFFGVMLSFMRFTLSDLDICANSTCTYSIGKKITILDIRAEAISALNEPCRKSIKLPGIGSATFFVESANFSANRYWTYGDYGMAIKLFYDDAHVHFGKCKPVMSEMTKIHPGLTHDFTSPEICVVFEPETDFSHLGGHVEGGRINIAVRVNIARCQNSEGSHFGGNDGHCFDLCSVDGVVKRCHESTTVPSATHPTTSTRHQQSSLRPDSYRTNIPTKAIQTTTHVRPQLPLPVTTYASQPVPIVHFSPKGNHSYTDPAKLASSTSNSFLTTSSTIHPHSQTEIQNFQTIAATTISGGNSLVKTTQRHAATDNTSKEERFGLVDGVYIFGGCALLILVVTSTGCCIVYRRKKCVCPKSSDTSTSASNSHACSTNKDLFWRDNWLVRYHNNPVFRQAESDVDYDQLDLEMLDNTRNMDQTELMEEDPYDDPWPLVRLDSDFVRNTKQLAKTVSCERYTNSDQMTHTSSNSSTANETNVDTAETSNGIVRYQNAKTSLGTNVHDGSCKLSNIKTDNNIDMKRNSEKHEPRQRFKGSFSIFRIRQSSSKSDKDRRPRAHSATGHIGHISRTNSEASDWYRDRVQSMKAMQLSEVTVTRKNRASSSSSGRSVNFEMIQQEVDRIEGTAELDADADLDIPRPVENKTGNQDWKVRTLYAMVSPRKDMQHSYGASGTIQFSK